MTDDAVAHWVGPVVRIGTVQRQRCMWCGAMIDETDLSRIAVQTQPGDPPSFTLDELAQRIGHWEPGVFVAVHKGGGMRWIFEDEPDGGTPLNSCCRLDNAVTS